ncbi:MAG: cytochrome P450 [Acidimicrobiia bacterium]|nr:cytochrome P450 [Acidimicrobiia bacterium]MYB24628.1 cytochrome P450 [Acidimicrobiia bacterium]MYE67264.1 cytochrome P450 [Acidimicrobiia bacterium]MYJ13868.1 cytochrome P450 [Acidimicrobiia bacterium]
MAQAPPQATTAPSNGAGATAGAAPPELSGAQPLVGHLREFQREPVAMLRRAAHDHGDLVRFRLGPRQFVIFSGPEAHDAYFRAPETQLSAKDVYQFTVPIFGRGVAYDVSTELMDEQLGFLYPALRESMMETFPPVMFEETCRLADALGAEGEIDLPRAMNALTVRIASRCLIGQEVRDLVDEGFADAYHDLQNGINTLGFFFPRLPTAAHRSRDRARRQIAAMFERVMSERRRAGVEPDDFMQTLMGARYSDGRRLNDEEIAGILLTVLFAGQHTSAVLATWIGLELAHHGPYADRIRTESAEVYGDSGTVSLAGLSRQAVLENAVRECERLHPPLILLIRKVLAPLRYRDRVVPARAMAMVSPAASHRLPEVFSDPDRFNPDRFAPPAQEDKQHTYALIGFGGGKHRCMGKRFAYLQLKAIWTVLLDRFDFEATTPVPAPHYGSWVTGPTEPCRLGYRRRPQPTALR